MADRYLVTGGGGFIGSALVRAVLQQGAAVRVLDDFSTGRRENLAGLEDRIQLVEGDVRDAATVARACEGVEFVLHQAALPSVPRSLRDPLLSHDVNVNGTLQLLMAAREVGVRRVVLAGSSSVYGDTPALPKVEAMPVSPLSPYAASKLAAEAYCRAFARSMGLETVVLRYFNVFGPRQDPASLYAAVLPRFVQAALRGESPVIYGDGTQSRDFTYVENAVAANLLACVAPNASGEVMNVAVGEQVTLLEVCELLARIVGRPVVPRFEPRRTGDVLHSRAGIERARERIGYEPTVSFAEGLRRYVAWCQESEGSA